MAWRSSGATNEALIENLSQNGLIHSERVKQAMLGVHHYILHVHRRSFANVTAHRSTELTTRRTHPTKTLLKPSATARPSPPRTCTPRPASPSCPS